MNWIAFFALIAFGFTMPLLVLILQWMLFRRAVREPTETVHLRGSPAGMLLIGISVLVFWIAYVLLAMAWVLDWHLIFAAFAVCLEAVLGLVAGFLSPVIRRRRAVAI